MSVSGSGADAAEFLHQGVVKTVARIFGQRSRLGVAEDLNRLFGGVHDQLAVLALRKMDLNRSAQFRIERLIQIIFQFNNERLAIH